MDQSIRERLEKIAGEVAKKNDVEFVHLETAGTKRSMTVRIFIDKPAGVTIEDCSSVSRGIEAILDGDDFIPSSYVLEVSSPGLERGLYTPDDYRKFAGKRAKVKTQTDINGQTNFTGKIIEADAAELVFDDKTNGIVRIPFSFIVKGNLKVDLAEEFKKR